MEQNTIRGVFVVPIVLQKIESWLEQAKQHDHIIEPTAMTLATAGLDGFPSARTVLLKAIDEQGAVFYTNGNSQKGLELAINPQASLLFYWMPLKRQIRISGTVTAVSEHESNEYFASRSRGSQIGAWASHQSETLESYEALMQRTKEYETKFEGQEVPRPEYWYGWRVSLNRVEFWHEGEFRLHHRELYEREASGWKHTLLNP